MKMARMTRLELAASSVTGWRSNQLSYTPEKGSDIVFISRGVASGNSHFLPPLFADLSLPLDHELVGGQFLQPHRSAGVQFIGTDADLSSHAEFSAIGEPR